jgi:hypothetical protein
VENDKNSSRSTKWRVAKWTKRLSYVVHTKTSNTTTPTVIKNVFNLSRINKQRRRHNTLWSFTRNLRYIPLSLMPPPTYGEVKMSVGYTTVLQIS